jgi:hypothetical protein
VTIIKQLNRLLPYEGYLFSLTNKKDVFKKRIKGSFITPKETLYPSRKGLICFDILISQANDILY